VTTALRAETGFKKNFEAYKLIQKKCFKSRSIDGSDPYILRGDRERGPSRER